TMPSLANTCGRPRRGSARADAVRARGGCKHAERQHGLGIAWIDQTVIPRLGGVDRGRFYRPVGALQRLTSARRGGRSLARAQVGRKRRSLAVSAPHPRDASLMVALLGVAAEPMQQFEVAS